MKHLYLLLPVALLCGSCSFLDLPADDLMPTSGGQISAPLLEENAEDAADSWGPSAGSSSNLPLRPLERSELGGDLGVSEPFPEYNRGSVSPSARIFLVAGSASDASHLQEIVVLRDYWLGEGYKSEQIACYYVKPEKAAYEADRKRFDSMATRAEGFYLAAPHVLFRHLKELATQQPSMVNLYVSGAGKAPTSGSAKEVALAAQYPEFAACYRIVLRGGPSGHMNERMRLEALRDGIDGHYLIFNAPFLAEALSELPSTCEKYVVLNGDYSGGFVTTGTGDDGKLRQVPGITVLASARHDRKSMAEGGELSQFGGLYLSALSSASGTVQSRSWRRMANELMVDSDKAEQHAGIRQHHRCRPVFYSALARESGPAAELASELAVTEEAVPLPPTTRLLPTSGGRQAPSASEPTEKADILQEGSALPAPKPAAANPFQWLKPSVSSRPVVSESTIAPKVGGPAPKAVVSPRAGGSPGMGRPGFGR